MTNVLIKQLIPSFVISKSNHTLEFLIRGDNFSRLKDQKIDVSIDSGAGVEWFVDDVSSRLIEFEDEYFFLISACPQPTITLDNHVYTDITIVLRSGGNVIGKQSLKVFYSSSGF